LVSRRAPRPATPPRQRSHSLAPEHVGEAGSAALLAMAVLGLAIFISGVAMIAAGLTMGGRYGDSPPPNVGQLGFGQVLGGAGLLILSACQVGSALAVLADVRGSRPAAAGVAGLSAALSAAGVLLIMNQPVTNAILAIALAVSTLIYAVAAIILGRPPR
jgi:hypothetical protein